jgi:ABC-type lipoprotein release transport system permease subunit
MSYVPRNGICARANTSGIVIGFIATFALTKLISAQLYGERARPTEPIVVTALLAVTSLLACWMAAQRALHVDPAISLRAD